MASSSNTGKKITLTLKQVYVRNGTTTGVTKPNIPSDPDYVVPSDDLSSCPVLYNTACPTVVAEGKLAAFEYEFSLLKSVLKNPTIKKIQVDLTDPGGTVVGTIFHVLPSVNYFHGLFSVSGSGVYTLTVKYLDSVDGLISSCTNVASGNVTQPPPCHTYNIQNNSADPQYIFYTHCDGSNGSQQLYSGQNLDLCMQQGSLSTASPDVVYVDNGTCPV
jgi:hypothetical protein